MEYYCDYEALEFNSQEAYSKDIYPYYLNHLHSETTLCPLYFSASNSLGDIIYNISCTENKISFLSFLEYISNFIEKKAKSSKKKKKEKCIIWFHNLNYDFRIIAHELFYNEFKQVADSETITYIGDIEIIDKNYNGDKAFSIIGENLSKFIGVNIYYKGNKFLLRDTMSILNMSQDKILKMSNMSSKIAVNWESININNVFENMDLIAKRCKFDTSSLAIVIERFRKTIKDKFNASGLTASSIAINAFKTDLAKNYGVENDTKEMNNVFRSYYPIQDKNTKTYLLSKGCYSGGICTLNPKYAGQELEKLQMIDINSSYPFAMTFPLPYGEGVEVEDFTNSYNYYSKNNYFTNSCNEHFTNSYYEYIVYIDFSFYGIPFQRCHSENTARTILNLPLTDKVYTKSQFPQSFKGYLCINSIDLCLIKNYGKIRKIEFKKGVKYETNTKISDFVKRLYTERLKTSGDEKNAYKLILNSLYGKFAQDLSGKLFNYSSMEDYEKVECIDNNPIYKPLASAVTSYARKNLIDTMYLIGDDFIYCDTDSLYFKNIDRCLEIFKNNNILDNKELGKWKVEEDYGEYIEKAKFLSKKNYLIQIQGKLKVTCVGLSHMYHNQINFENFELNSSPFTINKMINIYGGKAMKQTTFKIKERSFL